MPEQQVLLTVSLVDHFEVFEFRHDAQALRVGNGPQCDIVIDSRRRALSRLAGVSWRALDELGVRNLSYAHELWLEANGATAEPLRVQHQGGGDSGYARAVGAESAYRPAPDCVLVIQQIRSALPEPPAHVHRPHLAGAGRS